MVAREEGSGCLMGFKFSFADIGIFWNQTIVMVAQPSEYTKATKLYTFKGVTF